MTLGNEFKMHHLHAMNIEKTGQYKKLDDIVVRESALPWKTINKYFLISVNSIKLLSV